MRIHSIVKPAAVLAIALSFTGGPALAAGADPSRPAAAGHARVESNRGTVRITVDAEAARRTLEYWSPERMDRAIATPMPVETKPPGRDPGRNPERPVPVPGPVPAGPAVLSDPVEADPQAGAPQAGQGELAGPSQPQASGKPKSVILQEESRPYSQLGERTVGRVFGTIASSNFSCSATAINSPNRSLVWTAAHCIKLQGTSKIYKNWMFIPGYGSEGPRSEPYGRFAMKGAALSPEFYHDDNFHRDLGAVVVGTAVCNYYAGPNCVPGQRLTNAVGGQGLMFDYPRDSHFEARGYPVTSDVEDDEQFYCRNYGSPNGVDAEDGWGSPLMLQIPCGLEPGASGGPWLVNKNCLSCGVDQLGWVASVNSVGERYKGYPIDTVFGPYHGSLAKSLFGNLGNWGY